MGNWINSTRRRADMVEVCPRCGASNRDGKVSVKMDGGEPVYIRCHACNHSAYCGPRRNPRRLPEPRKPPPPEPPPPSVPWPETTGKRACKLAVALCNVYPAEIVAAVFELYGVVRDASGATLFPYAANLNDGVAAVKRVLYAGLKRHRETPPFFVVPPDRRAGFFRPKDVPAGAPVAAFESEKTALVWTLQNIVSGRLDAPVGVATGGATNSPAIAALCAYAGEIMAWPDNDPAGAAWTAALVKAAGKRVRVVPAPPEWPQGWDFADAVLCPTPPVIVQPKPLQCDLLPVSIEEAEALLKSKGWEPADEDPATAWRCARLDEIRPLPESAYAHTLADPRKADRMRRAIEWHVTNSPQHLPPPRKP